MENIICFIEKVDKEAGYLLLDFPPILSNEINYFQLFLEATRLENNRNGSTMLQILDVKFEKYKIPREGLFYRLPKELVQNNVWNINTDENTNYIAYNLEAKDIVLSFGNRLDISQELPEIKNECEVKFKEVMNLFKFKIIPEIKIRVNNVGQGNFNEVHIEQNKVICFDIGSRNSSKIKTELISRLAAINRQILPDQNTLDLKNDLFVLIISHWDVDHYNGIFNLSETLLDRFNFIVLPKTIPNQTSKRAYDLLPKSKVVLIEPKAKIKNRPKGLQCIFNANFIKFYRASKSNNRNKSGLLVSCHGKNKDAILSGDQKYELINTEVIQKCKNKNLILVVPHHGGHSGNVKLVEHWNVNEAIISVGPNPWNHPYMEVIREFRGKPLSRTDKTPFQFEWSL